jgi:acyl-CoA synthetase (AMP-forming)/AMP-acid ligase II
MVTLSNRDNFDTLLDAVTLAADNEKPAIIYVETERAPVVVSRHAFRARILATAASLKTLGIRPRDLVIIAHTQSLESIYAFWGLLALGAVPSMFPTLTEKLDPDVYMNSLGELVRLSAVSAVLTTDEFAPVVRPRLACAVFSATDITSSSRQFTNDLPQPDPDEIAFLQHSSGTTGLQKGVALSHAAVLNQLAAYSEAIELSETDVVVSWLPLYHDMGLIAGFLLPLMQGVPLVLMSPFDWVSHPALLFRAIHEHRGTLCWLPNFAYNHCAHRIRWRDSQEYSVDSMRLFINCSEPVRHDSHQLFVERFRDNGVRADMLGVSYAMAENTFAVTQTAPGHSPQLDIIDGYELEVNRYAKSVVLGAVHAQTRVSCGHPIAGTEVCILNEQNQVVPDRVVGEVAIRSNCLLTGYYRRPDLIPLNEEGWFLTGDMGYLASGELYIAGRRKDLIINAGKNIYPADIEAVVNGVDGVKAGRAVVFGVPDEREGTELVAVVAEVGPEDEDARRAIGRAIRQEVAHQTMVTVSYVYLVGPKWLLKTSSGKIARGANREKWFREIGKLV